MSIVLWEQIGNQRPKKFERNGLGGLPGNAKATIYITCVDNVQIRFNVTEMLSVMSKQDRTNRDEPKYWLDLGNSRDSGQGFYLLSEISCKSTPKSMKRWQAC